MNIPCPDKAICIDDINALGNYSSEEPDRLLFRSTYFPNQIWDDDFDIWTACFGFCTSTISQADANLCAQNNAKICERNKQFGNIETSCYKICPNGQRIDFTVPANVFYALSQAQANALASNWCQNYLNQFCDSIPTPDNPNPPSPPTTKMPPAKKRDCNDEQTIEIPCYEGGKGAVMWACLVWAANKDAANERARAMLENWLSDEVGCLVSLPKSVCKWEAGDADFNQWVVPTTIRGMTPPFNWEVFGVVPPGINFTPNASAMRVHGRWTQAGTYGFRLTMTDKYGTFTYRNYIISVMEIDEPSVLPNADQDQPYSHTISTQAGWDPKRYAVKLGSTLPCGLLLDSYTGTISGTPDCYGTFGFTITVSDRYGAVCEKDFTLTIDPNIFGTIPWVFTQSSVPNGGGSSSGGGYRANLVVGYPAGGTGGGTARASFHPIDGNPPWNCLNLTGAPLSCRVTLIVQTINSYPDQRPDCGIQHNSDGATFQRTAPGPLINVMNLGPHLNAGVYTGTFTIPIGASTWAGKFLTSGGQIGPCVPPAPSPGGKVQFIVTFEIL